MSSRKPVAGNTGQTQEQLSQQQKQQEANPPNPSSPTDKLTHDPIVVEAPLGTGFKTAFIIPSWFTKAFNYDAAKSVPNEWKSIVFEKTEGSNKINVREALHDELPDTKGVPKKIGKKITVKLPANLQKEVAGPGGTKRKITQASIRVPSSMSNSCIALWLAKTCDITGESTGLKEIKVGRVRIPLTSTLAAKSYDELGKTKGMPG